VELVERSQPLDSTPSQFANPLLHWPTRQVWVAHDWVAFARLQATPHPLQLVSVFSGTSQPSLARLLQLPKPLSHCVKLQLPETQASVALASAHASPQPLQFASEFNGVSQPGAAVQLSKPVLHAPRTQLPLAHDAAAFGKLHVVPHAAQFDRELS
jgi:hypothetical protein